MRRRKKQEYFQRIGDILPKVLKKRKIPVHTRDHRLSDAWNKAVGPIISGNTRANNVKGDTLFVKVSNSTWMQQLQFMKQDIIDKVNAVLKDQTIKNIYFSIGDVSPAPLKNGQKQTPDFNQYPLRERDRKLIEESIASVPDEELKSILKQVMTKEIINRRLKEG